MMCFPLKAAFIFPLFAGYRVIMDILSVREEFESIVLQFKVFMKPTYSQIPIFDGFNSLQISIACTLN